MFDDEGIAASTQFLKTWYNWKGEIPQKDDIVVLHWGNNSEESEPWKVICRQISGTKPKEIKIFVSKFGK